MRTTLPFLVLFLAAASLNAQFWTTAVSTSPNPATACGPFNLVIDGNKPATNYSLTTATALVVGSTINVTVVYTSAGIGLPAITPVNYNVPVATVPAGTYTVNVDYTAGGNLEISTWTITVDPCTTTPCSQAPSGLTSNANPNGSVALAWLPVSGSIACRIRGRLSGAIAWATTSPVFGVEPTSYIIPNAVLTDGATYDWQVQCACSLSPISITGWSATANFTAPTLRQAAASALQVFPNPATDWLQVASAPANEPFEIIDILGRSVERGMINGPIGVQNLPTGWYTLRIGEHTTSVPFLKSE